MRARSNGKIAPAWPFSTGQASELIRAYDWRTTPLGGCEAWPQSLRTAVDIMLHTRQPACIAWGPELTSLYNDAYIPLLGQHHAQALGRPFHEVWREAWDVYGPIVAATLAGEPQYMEDQPFALKSGRGPVTSWYTQAWTPLRDDNGAVRGLYCVASETTEKVCQEECLRALLENSPFIYWVKDETGRFVYLSQTCERRFGIRAGDWLGKTDFEVWPSEAAAEFRLNDQAVLESGQPVSVVEHTIDEVGNKASWLNRKFSFRDSEGRRYVCGLGLDISQQVLAEEALRISENRYRMLHESLRDGFAQMDMDSKIIDFNEVYRAMLGYSNDELRGMDYRDFTPERWREAEDRIIQDQIFGRGYSDVYEKEYRRKDDSIVPVEIRAHLMRDADGKPCAVWAIVRDVSERRQREQQIQLLMREVNHRSKNLLTLVQAVARHTARADGENFLDHFNDRVQSLAANQDLLVRSQWNGVALEELVRSQLAHFGDLVGKRIFIEGPALVVAAAASQNLAMIAHELATNASKYGALSNDKGRIVIGWSLEPGGRFAMSWREEDGPAVRRPAHRGFGTMVIDNAARAGLGAEVNLSFEPSGLSWSMTCPQERVVERLQVSK